MLINQKVMDEIVNKNSTADNTAEVMMQRLKQDIALEVSFIKLRTKRLWRSSTITRSPRWTPTSSRRIRTSLTSSKTSDGV